MKIHIKINLYIYFDVYIIASDYIYTPRVDLLVGTPSNFLCLLTIDQSNDHSIKDMIRRCILGT